MTQVRFETDFVHNGIEAFHVGGHTRGFTFYIFEDLLFICDYVFLDDGGMKYNPFGPAVQTVAGGDRIRSYLEGRQPSTVCGYNYTIDYQEWRRRFDAGALFGGYRGGKQRIMTWIERKQSLPAHQTSKDHRSIRWIRSSAEWGENCAPACV